MTHVAVTSLLRSLELEFFQSQPRRLRQDQKQIIDESRDLAESLRDNLRFVQSSLKELHGFDAEDREKLPRNLGTKLRVVALNAEDGIETELSKIYLSEPSTVLRQVLQGAVEEIGFIKEDLASINKNKNNEAEIMVGKLDELEMIMERLNPNKSNRSRQVVAVHGMGGIGKTVLAQRVYAEKSIKELFDKRAWVVISQHHNKKQMFSRLLKSIVQDEAHDGLESAQEQIRKALKGNRYLIVMDDVWTTDAWDDVQRCFPDDDNGSRVLLTTRLKNVAEDATTTNPKNCYQMRLLNNEESWNLFQEKLFLKAIISSNKEFERIGNGVVGKCYGLPLAVVVAAGLFWNLKTVDEWKRVENALDSLETTTTTRIKSIAERCADILALSYNHLPPHLKSCFLYFGFFPKNYPLIVKNLVRFWIAEGFVMEERGKRSEKVGARNLGELIDRNLVQKGETPSSYGKIRTCTIHDLLHDLSIKEAQNENLSYVVGSTQMEFSPSDCRWITARKESYSDPSLYGGFTKCRSFIYFEEDEEAIKLLKRGIFKQTLGRRKHISDLLQVSPSLKLLRVLEMYSFECLNELDDLSNWIANLVHLRRLSLIIGKPLTNFSLSQARNLQTLRISAGYQGMKDPFPPFILDELPQLRYLKCWPSCELFPPEFVHENLHSVSSISPVQCTELVFAKIPHLRKLSITGDERYYFIKNGKNLVFLTRLESLSIDFRGFDASQTSYTPTSFIANIASLHRLKKLKLMCTEIRWEDVNLLVELPKLKVLKLIFQACVGKDWKLMDEDCKECVFCSLKHLYIDYSSLVKWEATEVNFPVLERLILSRCFNLKEIPSDFAQITELQSIEIIDCLPSVEESANQIQEEQRDYGYETVKVIVHERPSNSVAGTSDPNEEETSREEDS